MAAAPVTMPIDPTNRELDYRTNNYKELESVERKQIACATCGKNLSAKLEKSGGVFVHPFMSTLQCKKCHDFYGDSDFSMDEDGDDKYCRMCGNGGELFICGNKPCPYGFCQKCIDRYIGRNSSEVQADDWKCLHCNCKPLWEVRAVCAVLLEKTKKRIKHRKKPTRAEVYDSDDDRSRSQELDNNFENSREVKRRPLRSMQNSKKEDKTLKRLKEICDTSADSHDNSLPVHKSKAGRPDSRTRSRIKESSAIHNSVEIRNSAGTSKRERGFSKKIISSEDETSDFDETQATRRKPNDSKTSNPFAELTSKSAKQTNNRSASQFLKRSRTTVNLSQKHPNGRSKSPENWKNPTSSSDPESSNESANDFVKSKKKKKFKTQEDMSNKKDSASQKKKADDNENPKSEVDLKHSNTKSGKVEKDNKIRQSSLEPKRTNLNHSVKDFGTNTRRKTKVKLPSRMNTSESDAERADSNDSTIPNKESAFHASRERKRSTGSVNEENGENEEGQSLRIHSEISKSLKVNKESGKAIRTKRLSTKSLYPTSETSQVSSSLDFHDKLLDRKKALLKKSFEKFSDNKDSLTKEDAAVIMHHVDHLHTQIEMFGQSICTGIDAICQKHSMNDTTSVQAVSKTVLRCSLLMIRCKKSLNIIEDEFIKSYEKWCQSSTVKSIFPDVENSDFATGNQVEPIISEETFVNSGKKNRIRQDSKKRQVTDNSEDSNEDENSEVSGSMLEKNNTLPDTEEKSLENNEEWSDTKSPEEIDHNIQEPVTRDSDGNSVSSRHDAISDCDSREIFSEIESGGQSDEADEPVTKKVLEKSSPLKASKTRSIESHSDELETETLEQIEEKSLQLDNVIERPENVLENQKEATDCPAEKITEESSTAGRYIEDTNQLDSFSENIHGDTVASDLLNTLNLNKESKQSRDGNHSASNDSESTDNLSLGGKSTVPDTEITKNSINDILMDDDDDTLELWDKSVASKQKSRHTLKHNNKQKTSLSEVNENEEDLSDCDSTIFTQLPSDELANEFNHNNVETEDTCISDSQIGSNTMVPLQSDDDCIVEAASPPNESSYSPETIPIQHKEADNSDTSEKPEVVSTGSRTSRKNQGSKNDSEKDNSISLLLENEGKDFIESAGTRTVEEEKGQESDSDSDKNSSIPLLSENKGNDSKESVGTGIVEEKEEPESDNDSEKNHFIPLLLEDDEDDSNGTGGAGTVEEEESQESENDSVKNHSILLLSENEGNGSKESAGTGTVEKDETRKSQKKLVTACDDDSEEAIKRKILESDSEWSDESTPVSNRSNSFQLKVNSDSEEYRKETIAMDTIETTIMSRKSNIGVKSRDSKIGVKKLKHDPVSSAPEDIDISQLNNLAKHRLLASSDTSSSDDDDVSSKSPANFDTLDLDSISSRENDEIDSSSANEKDTTILSHSKSKRKKFSPRKNYDYKTDKKLQMNCEVVVRKLDEKVLDQFRQLLGKSRERQELEDFYSLVDLNNIKKRKRDNKESNQSESSSESSSSKGNPKRTRSKQVQEKEETLLDHLEKLINGENYCNPSGDETEENNDILKKNLTDENDQDEFLTEANKLAKDFLIESSDSENEMKTLTGNAEEQEQEEQEQEQGGDEEEEEEEEGEEKEQKEEEEEEEQGEEEEEEEGGEEGEGEEEEQEQEDEDEENEKEKEEEEEEEEAEEEEQELTLETQRDKQKGKDISDEEVADSESNYENGSTAEKDNEETTNVEENVESKENDDTDSDRTRERDRLKDGLAKRNWRLTDSDSSDEEKKWNKSQLTKSDEKKTVKQEEGLKKKKKTKRRVLGSDSDSIILTDVSDDESSEVAGDKKNSSSDTDDSAALFNSLRKKKTRKRNAQKSDSDSDSDQDEKPSKQKRKRIKKMESDSDSDPLTTSQDTPGKLHRKNIRKVLKDKQVADVTKIAGKEEEERLRRIADRQKLYNEMYELKLANEAKVEKLILDFDEETKKVLVSVHEDLVKRLKPHQAQGIKFMWDACFESLERTKSTTGSGCIVAHCMGLGKTFQVVTLAHTLLTHAETGIKTIMVICPLSTVLNWVNEFKKWLGDINNDEDVEVFEMTKMKKNFERKYQLEKWHRAGGVMVLGYEMFRLLSNQTGKKMRKSLHDGILKCLVDPGPDLIVCDEGHLLKNEDTALSKAMRRVKTLRRIVLTGTPLQNNLVEYHCMVQFVKPNLLGTKKEFLNRFVNPITNGQFDDSTEYDVKLMKKRAHVLHKMLEGSVQRFDYSVLTPFLPPKQEYVITVRLAAIQIKLYQYYLDNLSRKKVGAGTSLFADFQALQRIWTHPIVLRMNAEKVEKMNEKKRMDASDSEGSLRDFLDDGSEEKSTTSEDSDIQSAHSSSDEKTEKPDKPRRGTRANPVDLATTSLEEEELPQSGEWWSQFVEPEHFEDMRISSKLVLLFAILNESEQIGDKVLVFSQSLYALSLIEEFLNKIDDETQRGTCSELIDNHSGSWSLGLDYFRLDGQTAPENRSHYCKIFNNPKNSRARLFLISTRAGGLGINLTAANRVIIFDASWNPSHDVQSIFRIYRFGQKKPCYVYRFLAQGTMEEKIYNRQVTKLSLSCRVVDEQQIERHYSNHDLAELYQFEPNDSMDKPTLNLPKDRLLAEILRKYEDRIETFHEHDSLLENKAEEELDEEERKEAWKEYEDERTGRKVPMNNFSNQNFNMPQYNDMMNMNPADIANRATLSGINIETLQSLIKKDYPNSTPEQQKMMTQRAIMDMYTYMENEAIRQQQIAAARTFTYPTVSNLGTGNFMDGNNVTSAQRQYAMQQHHQIMAQREQQANYAKRFGNVRGPGLSATATRPPPIINLQDDNDIIEVPTTPPVTAGPTPSSSVQTPSAAPPVVAENSKRQEE